MDHSHFAASSGKPLVGFLMTVSSALTHIAVTKVLCNFYELKFLGIAIATSVHFFVRFAVGTALVRCSNQFFNESSVSLFSQDSVKDLGDIFKIGI